MNRSLFTLLFISLIFTGYSQENCFQRMEKAFKERGAYTVSDDIHRHVIISFFENNEVFCVTGKARVTDGRIASVFLQYNDGTYQLMDQRITNKSDLPARITNGISEMIYAADGQKFRVVFIEKLKPKPREYKQAVLPNDL